MADSIEAILAVAEDPAYVRVVTARILLHQELAARHEQLDAELMAAMEADKKDLGIGEVPRSAALAQALSEFEDEIEESKVAFRFRALSKRAWADLIAQHPPTKEQLRDHAGLDHNPLTFPVAAVAASCSDPVMTLEQAQRLERSLNLSQWGQLWMACLNANIGGGDTPKSVAAGTIRRLNGASVLRHTTIASPEVSSLAEL